MGLRVAICVYIYALCELPYGPYGCFTLLDVMGRSFYLAFHGLLMFYLYGARLNFCLGHRVGIIFCRNNYAMFACGRDGGVRFKRFLQGDAAVRAAGHFMSSGNVINIFSMITMNTNRT